MNVPMLIGLRFSRGVKGSPFLSLLTRVSLLGLALGVMALVIVVSVMNGFDAQLKHRILGAVPHLVIEMPPGERPQVPAGVAGIAPFLQYEALMLTRDENRLVIIYGIDPAREAAVSIIPDNMVAGSLEQLLPGSFRVVLGSALAGRLGSWQDTALTLLIPVPSAGGNTVLPVVGKVRVEGTFTLDSELDYGLVLMNIEDLRSLTRDQANSWRVKLNDVFAVDRIIASTGWQLVMSWSDTYGDFFDTVKMEKIMMFLLLTLIVMIAAFNTVSGLSMMVKEKEAEIAVLRTMGLTAPQVMLVFLTQGGLIAMVGVSLGLLVGVPLAQNISGVIGWFEDLLGQRMLAGTYFDRVPSDVRVEDIIVIAMISALISLIATIYPAMQAMKIDPATVLRAE